jgi:gliding motility-associated-like protein
LKKRAFFALLILLCSLAGIGQTLTANFSADITSGCSPIVVNFQDKSTGPIVEWKWDFGNGATSTRQNPSSTYLTPGTYTVTLTVTDAAGNTSTSNKTNFITAYDEPAADFVADKRSGCFPMVVQFGDNSATPSGTTINSWLWDFGNGASSNQQNPKYVYRDPGSYTVTLTITNNAGCKKLITKPNYIDVSAGVVPGFDYTDPAVCSAPATVSFTNNSAGPGTLSYNWTFGDGQTSTSANASNYYAVNGNYHVTLFVSSSMGCADSASKDIRVGKVNTDFIVPASICPKTVVPFLNNSTPRPLQAYWSISNGHTDTLRNTSTVFPTSGTYTVTLINTYSICTDTLEKTITVQPAPTLAFTASDTAKCQPSLTVNFANASNGTSYSWDFGDSTTATGTNPSHTYTGYGEFNVTLIATGANGCADTLTKPGLIKIRKPVISFPTMPAKGCIPFPFTFRASVSSPDSVVSYNWDFGDGNTSTLDTPHHIYSVQGTYRVKLTITTRTGCTETYTMDGAVTVGTLPTPEFTSDVTQACADPGIQFINQSTGGNPLTYLWEFGDGSTSTLENPKHAFRDTGWINVALTAINNGCQNRIEKVRYAYIKPSVSRFSFKPNCNNPLELTFTDNSIGATTWAWDFGDGTTFTGKTPPPHVFPALGTYTVSLTTTNGSCTYKLDRQITLVDNTPDFTSTTREGCKFFTATVRPVVANPGMMRKYLWDFGNGTLEDAGLNSFAQFTYTKAGDYYVKLIAVDTFGCQYPITKSNFIRVNGPTAGFTSLSNSGCKGMTVTFSDTSHTDGVNAITGWKWDFGDSTITSYTAPPFTHTYDSIGDYDVKMVVTDAKGCRDSVTTRAFVKVSSLKADWITEGNICPNAILGFSNLTTSDFPYSSDWSFGDGFASSAQNPQHTYSDTGYYRVKLIVQDILGCVDSLAIDNLVHVARPRAAFTANNFSSYCTPFEARFQNTSYFYQSSLWDLGPQGTSTQRNPTTYYTNTGTYQVKLTVTGPGGCSDDTTATITIYNPSDGDLNYGPLSGCSPMQVDLSAFTQMNARFIWDFGDGNVIDTTVNSISHNYTDYGDFVPRIILKEPSGACVVPLVGAQTIKLLGAKADFEIDSLFFCDKGFISISDSTTSNDPAVTYKWDFGDGTFSSTQSPTHRYDTAGLYTVMLAVRTANGCTDTIVKGPVKVVERPHIAMIADTVVCANEPVTYTGLFQQPDTSVVRWNWVFPNGNTSTSQNPVVQKYPTNGSYTVTAIATNSSGCSDTASTGLTVHALPLVTMPPTLTKLVGVPITLSPTYSSGVTSYLWTPAETLSCADCPQPGASPKFSTTYRVVVTDSNTCQASGDVRVIVLCKGATVFLPNTFSPNGDGSNDMLYVRGVGLDRVKSLRIFNRWGEIVFEQRDFPVNNQTSGWNGLYKGNKAPSDVYIYQVEVFCENSEVIRFEGNVTLIR